MNVILCIPFLYMYTKNTIICGYWLYMYYVRCTIIYFSYWYDHQDNIFKFLQTAESL